MARASGGQPVGERDSLDEVAHDVGDIADPPDLVDGDDRRMPELRGCGLAEEAVEFGTLRQIAGPRDLHGHDSVEVRIIGTVDRAECPVTDGGHQFESTECRPAAPAIPRGGRSGLEAEGRTAGPASKIWPVGGIAGVRRGFDSADTG